MTEDLRDRLVTIARLLAAAVCVTVVVIAHRTVSWTSLAIMLAGLSGLLLLLGSYNRRYR